ncbi:MAG TPA: hypothetical protein VFK09_10790 [Gemmatimonadales bacterium]|nr:hypothetical protein [Gemmatimonadales bacterium]
MKAGEPPSRCARLWAALAVAAASAAFVHLRYELQPTAVSDFDQIWIAARALVTGGDPYVAVAALPKELGFPLFYPLTAVLLGVPFAWLPIAIARAVVAALGAGAFTYVILRRGWWGLALVASGSFLVAVGGVQWSPLLTAAALNPAFGFLLAAKPSVGLALLVAFPDRRTIIGCAVLGLLSLVVRPIWPLEWLRALHANSGHLLPLVARPAGVVLLLALVRWRMPEARLLAAHACVPQTLLLYDAVPLLLTARTLRQALVLAVTTQAAVLYMHLIAKPSHTFETFSVDAWPVTLVVVYLPVLLMILLSEPRTVEVPGGMAREHA